MTWRNHDLDDRVEHDENGLDRLIDDLDNVEIDTIDEYDDVIGLYVQAVKPEHRDEARAILRRLTDLEPSPGVHAHWLRLKFPIWYYQSDAPLRFGQGEYETDLRPSPWTRRDWLLVGVVGAVVAVVYALLVTGVVQ